jgi:hypothetical protein
LAVTIAGMCVGLLAVREEKEEFNDNGEFYCRALIVVYAKLVYVELVVLGYIVSFQEVLGTFQELSIRVFSNCIGICSEIYIINT